jgi:hypothetical protein
VILGTAELGRVLVKRARATAAALAPEALFHSFGQFQIILIGLELIKQLETASFTAQAKA